jgi:hypothetical protein
LEIILTFRTSVKNIFQNVPYTCNFAAECLIFATIEQKETQTRLTYVLIALEKSGIVKSGLKTQDIFHFPSIKRCLKDQDGVALVQFTGHIVPVNSDSHRQVKMFEQFVSETDLFNNLPKRDTESHPSHLQLELVTCVTCDTDYWKLLLASSVYLAARASVR